MLADSAATAGGHPFDTGGRNLRRDAHRHSTVEFNTNTVAGTKTVGTGSMDHDILIGFHIADEQLAIFHRLHCGVHRHEIRLRSSRRYAIICGIIPKGEMPPR